jgi:Protein of unknown function (DUF551)
MNNIEWKSVKEKPKDCQRCLVYGTFRVVGRHENCDCGGRLRWVGVVDAVWSDEINDFIACASTDYAVKEEDESITHWMPFPYAPEMTMDFCLEESFEGEDA